MPFDPFKFVQGLEKTSPGFSRKLTMFFLGFMSPFNGHLKTDMQEWTDNKAIITLMRTRGVRNHVAAIHAGAQFTLGETCAGLVIIRNFPFSHYRPLMSDVSVTYSKQARSDITGECILSPEAILKAHDAIGRGEIPVIELTTNISGDVNGQREIISVVKTVWQVKPWKQVRSK